MGEPKSISTIVEGLVKKRRWESMMTTHKMKRIWDKTASSGMRDHCRVASWRRGVLEIQADSSVWSQEVSFISVELAKCFNEEAGEEIVDKIVVRIRRN